MKSNFHHRSDAQWNQRVRGETEIERADRNWSALLQELRVVQTGVQLLTAFLLTLPFQPRFVELSTGRQDLYLATVAASIAATVFLVAPVAAHRTLFRQHKIRELVDKAHHLAIVGLAFLGLALIGTTVLIFDFVRGPTVAMVAGGCAAALFIHSWLVQPLLQRRKAPARSDLV